MDKYRVQKLIANHFDLINPEFLPILQAFANGEEIQRKNLYDGVWNTYTDLLFNMPVSYYRIKPKDEYVPFTIDDAVLFRDRWIKLNSINVNDSNIYRKIIKYNKYHVTVSSECLISYRDLLDTCKFDDDTPCGKIKKD